MNRVHQEIPEPQIFCINIQETENALKPQAIKFITRTASIFPEQIEQSRLLPHRQNTNDDDRPRQPLHELLDLSRGPFKSIHLLL